MAGPTGCRTAYSPLTRLMYVFRRDERRVFSKNVIRHGRRSRPTPQPRRSAGEARRRETRWHWHFRRGRQHPGGGGRQQRRPADWSRFAPEESWGKAIAIDPTTGATKWEHKVLSPPWGGVMSTAGNLVFGGTQEGVVFALDARSGERLWYFSGNERVYAAPISYFEQRQAVRVAARGRRARYVRALSGGWCSPFVTHRFNPAAQFSTTVMASGRGGELRPAAWCSPGTAGRRA